MWMQIKSWSAFSPAESRSTDACIPWSQRFENCSMAVLVSVCVSNTFQVAQWWRIHLQCRNSRRPGFDPWIRKIPWRREWLPTPVFLPGEFHGQRSLAGYSPWLCKESDMTQHAWEWMFLTHIQTTELFCLKTHFGKVFPWPMEGLRVEIFRWGELLAKVEFWPLFK